LALCRVNQVCKKFKRISEDDRLWEIICQSSVPSSQWQDAVKWKNQCRKYYEGYQDVHLFPNVTVRGWRRPNSNREPDECFKVQLLGDTKSGKTSALLRFANHTYTDNVVSNIGMDYKVVNVGMKDKLISLYIMDRDPTEVQQKKLHGVMIFYDITEPASFQNITSWIDELNKRFGEDIPKVIVGSKSDLESSRKVPLSAAQEFVESHNCRYVEISAKENRNVDLAFAVLVDAILKTKKAPENQKELQFHIPAQPEESRFFIM